MSLKNGSNSLTGWRVQSKGLKNRRILRKIHFKALYKMSLSAVSIKPIISDFKRKCVDVLNFIDSSELTGLDYASSTFKNNFLASGDFQFDR